jgi:signal transduction histidine kinase/ActR/RegA family two-component response regulator
VTDVTEHELRRILDALPIGVVLHRHRHIGYANRLCHEVLGLERLECALWRDLIELLDRYGRGERVQRTGAPVVGGTLRPTQTRLSGRDGRTYALEVVSCSFDAAGQPEMLTIAHDVTELSALEEQLRHAQKLESVGRLASGIAHDFNNLLTLILSGVEFLDGGDRGRSPATAEVIEEIRGAGERARELTTQLLGLARRRPIAPLPLDVNAVVRAAEKLLRRVLRGNVELVTSLDPALGSVRADAGLIEQVLLNLVVNAQDAMPSGGRLSIETANVLVDEQVVTSHPWVRPGPHVRLMVRDTGHGMAPDVKAHVFEPFFTTKPSGKGTGLGLATSYDIVKQAGGYVLVDSACGRGTTFEVHLPRTPDAPASSPSEPVPATLAGGDETVLVVEDDPRVRQVAVRALQAAGYRVLAAGNAHDAFAVTEDVAGRVDLLVCDVVMPGGNGPLVVQSLLRRWPDLRVLYVSGYAQDAVPEDAVCAQVTEFLQKPFTASSLLVRVRMALDAVD